MAAKKGSQWPEWMKPGIRVIRGPDYMGTVRDGNVANLGTLSYVPHQAGDNKVHVVWDTGLERKYKSGFTGQYELRAYDVQQVGIFHKNKRCKACGMKPIRGVRFHHPDDDVDLCTFCYMDDKLDISTAFVRIDTPNSDPVTMPTRKECQNSYQKLKLSGVFEKSKVIRGPHWGYPSKDGSALDEGTVMSFIPEKDGAVNGWVRVKWDIGDEVGEYRFGADGFVEVVASKVVKGATAYADHLPLVGILKLKVGDKVSVNLSLTDFKQAQKDDKSPDGWKDEMKQCLHDVGTIIEILSNVPLARVQYTNSNAYIISKSALWRRSGLKVGGAVHIISDKKQLEVLQKGNGPFKAEYCGKYGRVLSITDDGKLKLVLENEQIRFNPTACEPVDDQVVPKSAPKMPKIQVEEDDPFCVPGKTPNKKHEEIEAMSDAIGSVYANMKAPHVDQDTQAKQMYDAFVKADLKTVEQFLRRNKDLLTYSMDGKTILHLVSYEGYKDLLSTILDLGADVALADGEGDTALHYAAYAQKAECLQVLLQNGANVDAQNKSGTTALLIAVNHPCIDCVQKLIHNNADVSIVDSDGDTAMHDAIEQEEGQPAISAAVLRAQSADYSVENKKGFNVLQWAVFKDNRGAVDVILRKGTNVVEEKFSSEKYTALHIAATNDFVEVLSLLLDLGHAKPDSRDRYERTPLHLGVIKGRKRAIEVLIDKKADVNAVDVNGDTPLHLSQKKIPDPNMLKTKRGKGMSEEVNIQITYFLIEKGADITKVNNEKKTAMDYVEDPKLKDVLERVTAAYKAAPAKTQKGVRMPMHWQQMEVTDCLKVVLDLSNPALKAEHAEVAKNFMESMDGCTIARITRVQNPLLWEHYTLIVADTLIYGTHYANRVDPDETAPTGAVSSGSTLFANMSNQVTMRKKREMEFRYGQGCANELHLYHGTRPDLVDIISYQNFDFRIAGSNVGALYGEGSYFATTAKYSDLYSHQNDEGHKVMFVAKVLAGKTAQGKPGLKRPPEVDPSDFKKGLYDCCVDNVLRPKIYCVFDVNQYYPEYIVEYR